MYQKKVAKPESQQMGTVKLFTCIIGAIVIFFCGANEIWFVAQMKDFFGTNEIPIGTKALRRYT